MERATRRSCGRASRRPARAQLRLQWGRALRTLGHALLVVPFALRRELPAAPANCARFRHRPLGPFPLALGGPGTLLRLHGVGIGTNRAPTDLSARVFGRLCLWPGSHKRRYAVGRRHAVQVVHSCGPGRDPVSSGRCDGLLHAAHSAKTGVDARGSAVAGGWDGDHGSAADGGRSVASEQRLISHSGADPAPHTRTIPRPSAR